MKTLADIEVTIQDSPKEKYKIVHSDKLREWAREELEALSEEIDKQNEKQEKYSNQDGSVCGEYQLELAFEMYKTIGKYQWIEHAFNLEDK